MAQHAGSRQREQARPHHVAVALVPPGLRRPGLIKRLLMTVVNMAMGGQSFISRLAQQNTDQLIRKAIDELGIGDPDGGLGYTHHTRFIYPNLI